jgi:thioredoxin-related protein
MNTKLLTLLLVLFTSQIMAQQPAVEWLTFEKASSKMSAKPKKIIIDVYTNWCGWCKKMDQTTFTDPVIAAYMTKNFYSVKFNAESKDTLVFKGKTFVNPTPNEKRSAHQFAKAILQGKMSYPSYVLMDEDFSIITVIPGYMTADKFEPLLHYFATESYKTIEWKEYNASFKGSFGTTEKE